MHRIFFPLLIFLFLSVPGLARAEISDYRPILKLTHGADSLELASYRRSPDGERRLALIADDCDQPGPGILLLPKETCVQLGALLQRAQARIYTNNLIGRIDTAIVLTHNGSVAISIKSRIFIFSNVDDINRLTAMLLTEGGE